MSRERCFYVPGAPHIIDVVHPLTGRTAIYQRTLAEVQAEEPGAVEMDLEDAHLLARAARRALHVHGPVRITEERFNEALNCLPPGRWVRHSHAESFYLIEFVTDDLVRFFVRFGDPNVAVRYFTICDSVDTSHEELMKRCRQARRP